MAKYYGLIGFETTEETRPGVYEEVKTVRDYYGDVIKNTRRLQNSGNVNDDVIMSNQISIVSDPFALTNFHTMRYAEYLGTKWKITDVEVQYPRLILTLGGIYNA